ncbi:hypothetical protein Hanom_Chr09g00809591 [Helianthus anomalus]
MHVCRWTTLKVFHILNIVVTAGLVTPVQKDSWSDWLLVQIVIRLRWGGCIAMSWFARATRYFKPIRVNIKPSFLRVRLGHFPILSILPLMIFLVFVGFYLKKIVKAA